MLLQHICFSHYCSLFSLLMWKTLSLVELVGYIYCVTHSVWFQRVNTVFSFQKYYLSIKAFKWYIDTYMNVFSRYIMLALKHVSYLFIILCLVWKGVLIYSRTYVRAFSRNPSANHTFIIYHLRRSSFRHHCHIYCITNVIKPILFTPLKFFPWTPSTVIQKYRRNFLQIAEFFPYPRRKLL